MHKRILVVDDEAEIRELLADILTTEGYDVVAVGSGEDAILEANIGKFDIVLLDVRMPGIDGIKAYWNIKKINPSTRAIITTAFYNENEIMACIHKGVDIYLPKPFEVTDLLALLKTL